MFPLYSEDPERVAQLPSTLIPAGVHRPVRFTDKERLKALRTPKHTVGLLLSDFQGHCISCLPPLLLTWAEGGGVCPARHGLGLPGLSPGYPPPFSYFPGFCPPWSTVWGQCSDAAGLSETAAWPGARGSPSSVVNSWHVSGLRMVKAT